MYLFINVQNGKKNATREYCLECLKAMGCRQLLGLARPSCRTYHLTNCRLQIENLRRILPGLYSYSLVSSVRGNNVLKSKHKRDAFFNREKR